MKIIRTIRVVTIFCVMSFATMNCSNNSTIGGFTQQTLDGKTIDSETLKGMPMVINVASPW